MGVTSSTTGLENLIFNSKSIMGEIEDALEESLNEGADEMRGMIESRGTGNQWSRPGPSGRTGSYPGRVDSGNMLNDVESQISDRGDNYVEGWLGWKDNSPLYYRLQENGFNHRLAGRDIPGMMALRDAAEETEKILEDKLRRIGNG